MAVTVEITEEAVDAAAEAEWCRYGSHNPYATWETEDPDYKEHLRNGMRAALAAAAPFLTTVAVSNGE